MFNGLNMGMGSLYRLSDAQTRSISPENYTGEKGKGGMCELADGFAGNAARELGRGWKVNPFIRIPAGESFTIADVEGPGCIQHIWLTPTGAGATPFCAFTGITGSSLLWNAPSVTSSPAAGTNSARFLPLPSV